MTNSQRKLVLYREQNLEAARIILSDITRYGGEGSLMVRWARLVLNPPAEQTATGRAA